jgi:hypothetical protein
MEWQRANTAPEPLIHALQPAKAEATWLPQAGPPAGVHAPDANTHPCGGGWAGPGTHSTQSQAGYSGGGGVDRGGHTSGADTQSGGRGWAGNSCGVTGVANGNERPLQRAEQEGTGAWGHGSSSVGAHNGDQGSGQGQGPPALRQLEEKQRLWPNTGSGDQGSGQGQGQQSMQWPTPAEQQRIPAAAAHGSSHHPGGAPSHGRAGGGHGPPPLSSFRSPNRFEPLAQGAHAGAPASGAAGLGWGHGAHRAPAAAAGTGQAGAGGTAGISKYASVLWHAGSAVLTSMRGALAARDPSYPQAAHPCAAAMPIGPTFLAVSPVAVSPISPSISHSPCMFMRTVGCSHMPLL